MKLDDFKALVMEELFKTEEERLSDKSRDWPPVRVTKDGVDAIVLEGLVADLLDHFGFKRVTPTLDLAKTDSILFAKVESNGRIAYVETTWKKVGEDRIFNPFTDINYLLVPEADIKFVTGPSFKAY